MQKSLHPIVCYPTIAILTLLSAALIYRLTIIDYPDTFTNLLVKKPLNINSGSLAEDQASSLDFSVRAHETSDVFKNSGLESDLNVTDGHFAFNEILSNSGNEIAYSELSNCAGSTSKYNSENVASLPKCDWDAAIRIKDLVKGTTRTIDTGKGNEQDLAGARALVYFPIAWTKNDNALVLKWANIGNGGAGGAPAIYSSISAQGGDVKGIGDWDTIFVDDYNEAIVVGYSNQSPSCGEEVGNSGKISLFNLETGAEKILAEEQNTSYRIDGFNRIDSTLTYKYRGVTGKTACDTPGDTDPSKQIKI